MKEIKPEEAESLADSLGMTWWPPEDYVPVFPILRKDVCAIKIFVKGESTSICDARDALYLIWKTDEELKYQRLTDREKTGEPIDIKAVVRDSEGGIVVKIASPQSDDGFRYFRKSLEALGLK